MAAGKYGRLFTERDVRALLRYAAQRGAEVGSEGIESLGRDPAGNRLDPGDVLLSEAESYAAGPFGPPLSPTFPADEPLFLLRGQDAAAPYAIQGGDSYYAECITAGHADGDDKRERLVPHLEAVQAAADAMLAWQREHPDRVKRPD